MFKKEFVNNSSKMAFVEDESSGVIHSLPHFRAYVGSPRAFSEHSQYSAVLCDHLSRAQVQV